MQKCETCGNEYHNCLQVQYQGETYYFDCFECAITKIAPRCAHCNVTVIGHGTEMHSAVYCCESCLRQGTRQEPIHAAS